jgi:hypothetical protein
VDIPSDVYTKLFILTKTLAKQNITIVSPTLNGSIILSIMADNKKLFDFQFKYDFSAFNDSNQPHKVYCDGELILDTKN